MSHALHSPRRDAATCPSRRRYALGCRCFPCRRAENEYQTRWNSGNPARIDVDIIRDHIEQLLSSGWNKQQIMDAANLGTSTVWHITSGKQQSVNSRTANAILDLAPRITARQHLAALVQSGLTLDEVAAETGLALDTVQQLAKGRTPKAPTADAIRAVEPLPPKRGRIVLEFEPLRRHLEPRMLHRGHSIKSLGEAERRAWHRAVRTGQITEARADKLAIQYGLLLEEVYGHDYDEVAA